MKIDFFVTNKNERTVEEETVTPWKNFFFGSSHGISHFENKLKLPGHLMAPTFTGEIWVKLIWGLLSMGWYVIHMIWWFVNEYKIFDYMT